jgi:adenosine deaminase
MRTRIVELEQGRRAALGCDSHPESPACQVTVRYILEVLRESPKEQVFAQTMAGFRLASMEPLVVGINFVQAEDGFVSMRDYSLHMRMVGYARRQYPKVHVSLHAGELAPGLTPPDGLRFHVREAVDVAGAERIGHGVDILCETGSRALLERMRQRHILVEINLTSNDLILGVRGSEHPLPAYRRAGVPVAISTDDEGVARSHLTAEFLRAVLTYKLSYADVKEMVRNSLRYAFVDETAKAQLQTDLEARFRDFEQSER